MIWVYSVGEDGVQAFTEFGIENLLELIKFYKETPRCYAEWIPRTCGASPRSTWITSAALCHLMDDAHRPDVPDRGED